MLAVQLPTECGFSTLPGAQDGGHWKNRGQLFDLIEIECALNHDSFLLPFFRFP